MTDTVTPDTTAPAAKAANPRPPRAKKPNYNLIHADPLPLKVVPLPPLIPHNPLSWLYIAYIYLFPPASSYSHPTPLYKATFSKATSSVNVTDSVSIQGLWCRGFFGKGSLSRSEPTWLTRTRRRLGIIGQNESLTAEELTGKRRNERREFKMERAKKEKEKLEQILAQEGKLTLDETKAEGQKTNEGEAGSQLAQQPTQLQTKTAEEPNSRPSVERPVVDIEDLEYLQLTLEEAFFLSFGLGVLKISDGPSDADERISNIDLFTLFRRYSYFPPRAPEDLQVDDPFLLNYVVYHHFRSLGWVVKPGVKFAVDYCKFQRFYPFPFYTHTHTHTCTRPFL